MINISATLVVGLVVSAAPTAQAQQAAQVPTAADVRAAVARGEADAAWALLERMPVDRSTVDLAVELALASEAPTVAANPNISGVMLRDQARHYDLCELALEFAVNWLKPDGAFLVKVFQGVGFEDFRAQMRKAFEQVLIRKPDSSRDRNTEVYLLGRRPKASPVEQDAAVTSEQN